MVIEKNKSLKSYNTFGIDCRAKAFCEVTSEEELKDLLSTYSDENLFILGGGSNMLLTQDLNALVVHINLKGISVLEESKESVILEAKAGENWHEFVQYCISKNLGGLENLSLIPGNVGTAPIQNIGAYGVELKDVFESCTAIHRSTLETVVFGNRECKFGYRESIFKKEAKNQYIITAVRFKLQKPPHQLNTGYGAIQSEMEGISSPTIKDVSEAVIAIRRSKLPDPSELGNSGSFFKNPVLDANAFQSFLAQNSQAPFYEVSSDEFKIPAGWLIEQTGFKGKRFGDAGVHKHQALVLVNYGNASGKEVWDLAMKIQQEVLNRFNILLEPEVNVF